MINDENIWSLAYYSSKPYPMIVPLGSSTMMSQPEKPPQQQLTWFTFSTLDSFKTGLKKNRFYIITFIYLDCPKYFTFPKVSTMWVTTPFPYASVSVSLFGVLNPYIENYFIYSTNGELVI